MFWGRNVAVFVGACAMVATLMAATGSAVAADSATMRLSYNTKCDEPHGQLKPPTARILAADGSPLAGVTVTWGQQTRPEGESVYRDEVAYATAVTDASGTAAAPVQAETMVGAVRWYVRAQARSLFATAHQVRLGVDRAPVLSAAMRQDLTSPAFYGTWSAQGTGVTRSVTGETSGSLCPTATRVGAPVELFYQSDTSGSDIWASAGTTAVDVNGNWQLPFLPGMSGKYVLRAEVGPFGGVPAQSGGSARITLTPAWTSLSPTGSSGESSWLELVGSKVRPLSFTLQTGPFSGQTRTAELWFRDQNTEKTTLIRTFRGVPVVGRTAVFAHRLTVGRSGIYTLRYRGSPVDQAAEAYTTVRVDPTLRGWPAKGRKTTLHKQTRRTRTITVGALQSSRQRVLLLSRNSSAGWDTYNGVRTYKPNSRGQVTISIPRGWRGTRGYKVFVGDVVRHKFGKQVELLPGVGTTSTRWTITRK